VTGGWVVIVGSLALGVLWVVLMFAPTRNESMHRALGTFAAALFVTGLFILYLSQ
jgi:hypothetical protein